MDKDRRERETDTFEKRFQWTILKGKSLKNEIRLFLYNHVKQNITPNRLVKIRL